MPKMKTPEPGEILFFLRVDQLAARRHATPSTVRDWVKHHRIPSVHPAGGILFSVADVEEREEQGRRP